MNCSIKDIYNLYLQEYAETSPDPMTPQILTRNTFRLSALWEYIINNCDSSADLPYWAVVWPGGRAMAHFLSEIPFLKGKRILDFGAGNAVAAVAAGLSGAAPLAIDADPAAVYAGKHMAELNGIRLDYQCSTLEPGPETEDYLNKSFDYIFCSDVFYEKQFTDLCLSLFSGISVPVIFADPGRNHTPYSRLEKIVSYRIPVYPEIENVRFRDGTIYQLRNGAERIPFLL